MSLFNIAVLISGSGTNLQAIIDAIDNGNIKKAKIAIVISNREGVFGLKRAEKHGIHNIFINPEKFETREDYDRELVEYLKEKQVDLVVLAGYMNCI